MKNLLMSLSILISLSSFANEKTNVIVECKAKTATFKISETDQDIILEYKIKRKYRKDFFSFLNDERIVRDEIDGFSPRIGIIRLEKIATTSIEKNTLNQTIFVSGATDAENIIFKSAIEEMRLNYPNSTFIPAVAYQFIAGHSLRVSYYKDHVFELDLSEANCY